MAALALHPLDMAVLAAFAVIQTIIGIRIARRKDQTDTEGDFLLDGRRLTLPAFVASLVCTWYGGILGVGEFTYLYGISNWLVFGVPYYLWAAVFATFLARRARHSPFVSISDHLYEHYGRSAGIVGSALVFVMVVPAPYVLMLGVLGQLLFGIPLWIGVIIGALLSVIYVYIGGFRSVIRTDVFQFILMFGGFLILVPMCIASFGGWGFLRTSLPDAHLTWDGGNPLQFILVWYIIASATLIDPAFYQRCYAARTPHTAQRGIWYAIGFWLVFDFLTTTAGLYARAALPDLTEPVAAFPQLAAAVLPPGILGLFLVGVLAGIISTVDSYSFLAGIAVGRDIIWRNLPNRDDSRVLPWTRVGLWFSAALAAVLAISSGSVVGLWHDLGSVAAPALVVPVLSTFSRRWTLPNTWATLVMLFGGSTSLVWLLAGRLIADDYPLGLEPIIPGLALALGMYLIGRRQSRHS